MRSGFLVSWGVLMSVAILMLKPLSKASTQDIIAFNGAEIVDRACFSVVATPFSCSGNAYVEQ